MDNGENGKIEEKREERKNDLGKEGEKKDITGITEMKGAKAKSREREREEGLWGRKWEIKKRDRHLEWVLERERNSQEVLYKNKLKIQKKQDCKVSIWYTLTLLEAKH